MYHIYRYSFIYFGDESWCQGCCGEFEVSEKDDGLLEMTQIPQAGRLLRHFI